jgi:hypothetical protein
VPVSGDDHVIEEPEADGAGGFHEGGGGPGAGVRLGDLATGHPLPAGTAPL